MPTKVQPALGDTVAVAVPAGGKGGFLWDAGGSVARVTKGGLVDKHAIKPHDWRLSAVGDDAVAPDATKHAVGALVSAAQKSGRPFALAFVSAVSWLP